MIETNKDYKIDNFFKMNDEFYSVIDFNGIILSSFGNVKQVTGYDANELEGKFFMEFVPEEYQEFSKDNFTKITNNEETEEFVIEFIKKDNTTYWGSVKIKVDFEDLKIYAKTIDVTKNKLEEFNSRALLTAIENSQWGVVMAKPSGTDIFYVNDYLCNLLGRDKEDFDLLTVKDLYPEHKRSEIKEKLSHADKDGYVIFKSELLHSSGASIPAQISSTVIKDSFGVPHYRIANIYNLSEIVKAEDESLSKSYKLEVALKSARLAFAEGDFENQIIQADEVFQEIFDFDKKIIALSEFVQLVHPENIDEFTSRLMVWEDGKEEEIEYKIILNGKTKYIRSNFKLFKDSKDIKRVYSVHKDITVQKEKEIAITDEKNLTEALFDKAAIPIGISKMTSGEVIKANKEILNLMGAENQFVITKDFYNDERDFDEVRRIIQEKGFIRNFPTSFQSVNGSVDVLLSANIVNYKGENHIVASMIDVTEKKIEEKALKELASIEYAQSNEDLFYNVLKIIYHTTKADYAFIGTLNEDSNEIYTDYLLVNGEIQSGISYGLSDTPCADVYNSDMCIFNSGVTNLYPKDQLLVDMEVDAYIGSPIFDSENNPLGILVCLFKTPQRFTNEDKDFLKICSTRVGNEFTRMRYHKNLLDSENRLQTIIQNLSVPVVIIDMQTMKFDMFNKAAYISLEYNNKEFNQLSIPDIDCKLNEEEIRGKIEKVRKVGSAEFETTLLTKSGRKLEHRISIEKIKYADKDLMATVWHDVSEEKQKNQIRIEREKELNRHRNIISELLQQDQLRDGDLEFALESITKSISHNLPVERVSYWEFNKEQNSIILKKLFLSNIDKFESGIELFEKDHENYFKAIKSSDIVDSYDSYNDEITSSFKEGYLDKFEIRSLLDVGIFVSNQLVGVLCLENVGEKRLWKEEEKLFVQSMSSILSEVISNYSIEEYEHKLEESQEKLVQSERIYESLVNSLHEGIVMQDSNGKIIASNKSAETVLGLTRNQLYGRDSFDPRWKAIKEDSTDLPGEEHPASITLATGKEVIDTVMGIVKPNGERSWINVSSYPIYYGKKTQGKPDSVVASFTDITERRKYLDKLISNKRTLENMEMIATIGSWSYDINNESFTASYMSFNILGIDGSEDESIPLNKFLKNITDEDKNNLLDLLRKASKEQFEFEFEFKIKSKNRKVTWVKIIGSSILEKGSVVSVSGAIQDVTDFIEAQKSVESQNKENEQVLTTTNEGYIKVDLNNKIVYVNSTFCAMIGLTRDEILGQEFRKFVDPSTMNIFEKQLEIRTLGYSSQYELRLSGSNNKELNVIVSAAPLYDSNEYLIGSFAFITDITTTKKFEIELVNTLRDVNKYKTALDLTSIIAITDLRGYIKFANQKFADISGFEVDELIGAYQNIVNSAYHPDSFWKEMWITIKRGDIWHDEVKNRKKNGDFYWVDTYIIPIRNENGNIFEFFSIRKDITSRKFAEEQLVDLNKNLETKVIDRTKNLQDLNKEKDQLIGMVSHDLKNPLSGIILYSDLIENRGKLIEDSNIIKSAEKIKKTTNRMNEIITNLLDLNRVESGTFEVLKKDFNFNSLLDEVINQNFPSFNNKKQNIIYSPFEEDLIVYNDPNIVAQILDNIISNAIKYSEIESRIWINLEKNKEKIIIEIKDEGQGIAEEEVKNLFKKFTKLSSKPTAGESSTGLGLSIVKHLVEACDGKIKVESKLGIGSSFFVEIPII